MKYFIIFLKVTPQYGNELFLSFVEIEKEKKRIKKRNNFIVILDLISIQNNLDAAQSVNEENIIAAPHLLTLGLKWY